MKQTFTLVVTLLVIALTNTSKAQINEGFESNTLEQLTINCWSFYGATRITASTLTGAYAVEIIPTTSNSNTGNSNTGQIVTPYMNFTTTSTVSLNYRLSGTSGSRWVEVKLYDQATGLGNVIQSINLTATSKTSITATIPANSGIKRLVLDFFGSGGGNVYEYVDDIAVSAPGVSSFNCLPVSQAPMPIKLLSFSGSINNKKAELKWTVAENETGDRFEVEKSNDGRSFTTIGAMFCTDKVSTESYSFREASELTATAYYRIKIINKDNSTSYSKIVTLQLGKVAATNTLTLVQNPVASTLQFQCTSAAAGSSKLVIYNTAGREVFSKDISLQKGINAMSFDLGGQLATGAYIVKISNGTEQLSAKMLKK